MGYFARPMTLLYSYDRGRFALQDDMRPQSVPQKLLSQSTMNVLVPVQRLVHGVYNA